MENNSSYKIYITKDANAAHLISRGLREWTPGNNGQVISTSSGCVRNDCRIPEIYHGEKSFYALAEYRNGEHYDIPKYELIIC